MTHKFVDHSVIVHPLSITTEQSFNRLGWIQTTIYNLRMMQLVEMSAATDVKICKIDPHHYQRAALYDEAEKAFYAGSYLLRANKGHTNVQFEGSVILDIVNIVDGSDAMPTLQIRDLGHFTIDASVRDGTLELLKNIARHQQKSTANIRNRDDHLVVSDQLVRFELVRPAASNLFLLRIRNLN